MADPQSIALRMVLVGKTGSGKSATGNTILGEQKFQSKISAQAITKNCQKGFREWNGKKLLLVDTPGLFDTKETLKTTCTEISKCVVFSCPGPHAIILVIQLGRYTEEEQKTVDLVKILFGERALKYMIILFTRKDELNDMPLCDFIKESDEKLQSLIKDCGNRFLGFSNKATEAEKEGQVQELIELIEKMVQNNGGSYFSCNIYEEAQETLSQCLADLEKKYSDQLTNKIEQIEKTCTTEQKKKEEIAHIQRYYDKKAKEIYTEAKENVIKRIFKIIWKLLCDKWHKFWE